MITWFIILLQFAPVDPPTENEIMYARFNRRQLLQCSGLAAIASTPVFRTMAADKDRRFQVGACDWSLGKRHDLAALKVAEAIGLDGVQVSFGDPQAQNDLRKQSVRDAYAAESTRLGVRVASLAMGVLNQRPYASDADAERWVSDCIGVMAKMRQRVVLLAFFGKGNIKDNAAAQKEVVRRLKKVAPQAEKSGVVLGLETRLNATEHLRILDAVGSPAVQVYYDVANMHQGGYDIYSELEQLGADRICEIHTKEYNHLLGQGEVDFPRVKQVLDKINWTGWLIIESATVKGKSLEACYKENQQYLRSLFPTT